MNDENLEVLETEEQKQARASECGRELEVVLKKWNCNIDVGMRIFGNRNEPIVSIVPK